MKNIRAKVAQMQAQLEDLENHRHEILYSGRDEAWQKRQLNEAVKQTRQKLRDLQSEALEAWLEEYGRARHKEVNNNYVERNFYQQKFAAMLNQVSPEQLPALLEKIANDGEMNKYKNDFLDLADLKIDEENQAGYEQAKQKRMTPDEKAQKKEIDMLANMKNNLTTINNLANDLLIEDVTKGDGEPSMDLVRVFDEAAQIADKNAGKGVGEKNEDREENKELMREAMEISRQVE